MRTPGRNCRRSATNSVADSAPDPATSGTTGPLEAARRRALDALAGRDLLAAELDATLARAGHDATVAARIRHELVSRGLLDEDRAARDRIRRWRDAGRSVADIRARLLGAGLAEPAVDRLLTEPSVDAEAGDDLPAELAAAIEAVRRRGRGLDRSAPADVRRLAARLGRAGFEPDIIRQALTHCGFDDALLDD